MTSKKITREHVAHFLEVHLENVMRLEKEKPGSLNMVTIVKEANKNGHVCGTVCCMDGWLPYSFPHLYCWIENTDRMPQTEAWTVPVGGISHTIKNSPIPEITKKLWSALTAATFDKIDVFGISMWSTPEKVFAAWSEAIKDIRAGKLDEYLNFD